MRSDPLARSQARTLYPASSLTLAADAGPIGRSSAFRPETQTSMLAEYLRTFKRWRLVIALCALIGGLLSVSLSLGVMPLFEARTSLEIEGLNTNLPGVRDVSPSGESSSSSSEGNIQTQIKLLQSASLLNRTVERLKAESHPAALDKQDMISQIKRSLHLSKGGELPYDVLVESTAKRVKVKPLGVTRLVEVTCDSYDPRFSAHFCNTLVEQFKALDLETRGHEAETISGWLTQQVADVRERAQQSQKALEAATGGDGLALSQASNNIGADRMRQLQGELVRAQADRMQREADERIALSSDPDSIPAVRDSPTYRQYQQKLADLNAQIASLVPPLTEENPRIVHLRSQTREVQAAMAAERASILARVRNDFESARHHEELLTASYATLQSTVSNEMSKTARVDLLRREVDGDQQLYQTLLQRAKEAGFATAMQSSTIRVVDPATANETPISPKRQTAAIVGVLLGTLGSLAYSLIRERNSSVFRAPGETERLLHIHELGVIPSADVSPRRPGGRSLSLTPSLMNGDVQYSEALTCWGQTYSIVAEAYRSTTHSILLANPGVRRSRVYTVTSPNASEGKTTVTSNLGVALSKARLRVLLIDGDLRKPGLHRSLGVENRFGLRNLLRGEIDLAKAPISAFCTATSLPNLSVIPAGIGNEEVVELLHAGATMEKLMARLASEFDVVLIDTPPMLHMADARVLAARSEGVILVLRASSTSREQAISACEIFEHDKVPIVGTILNDFNPQREGKLNYYKSYYQYAESQQVREATEVV